MAKIREDVTSLTIYTGSNGKKGCTCKCVGCSQEKYGLSHPLYQGKIEQILNVLNIFPNLKRAIILGNPDPSVDTEFCNRVSKLLIENNVKVRFSTSGFNPVRTVQILCDGLNPNMVDYISFSIDTINEEELAKMKNQKISFSEVEKAIKWCNEHKFRVKIQPTLWTANLDNYKEIIDFFNPMGVKWFSFHAGSCEAFVSNEIMRKHVDPWEWRNMLVQLGQYCIEKGISLHMPYLFLNDEEYALYTNEKGARCKTNNLRNTQIWLENNYIRTTHCPLLNEIYSFQYNLLSDEDAIFNIKQETMGYCPIAKYCLGSELSNQSTDGIGFEFASTGKERLRSICRLYNFTVNYPQL